MSKTLRNLSLILPLFFIISCSTTRLPPEIQTLHSQASFERETIAIVGTNDLHGALLPVKSPSNSGEVDSGGASFLASYIRLLRSEWGEHMIWVDAGDEFQGEIESAAKMGAPVVDFYNHLGLNAATLGNHEFDFGLDPLRDRTRQANYPYVINNVFKKVSEQLPDVPNLHEGTILRAGKLRVGIIGLTTLETPEITNPDSTRGLVFTDLKDTVLKQSRSLREDGADIILLVAHVGIHCLSGRANPGLAVRKPSDPQGVCTDSDELSQLLKHIPAGTVDAVVSGHSHTLVHHWAYGTPVIQGGAEGRYFNIIYLTYDHEKHRVLTDETRIEGPVPVCPAVFQRQGDCNTDRPSPRLGRGPLVRPKFHGKTIRADSDTAALLAPIFRETASLRVKPIGTLEHSLPHNRFGESRLGDVVADAMRDRAKTDIAIVNGGFIRKGLDSGVVDMEALFRAIPYENRIAKLKVSGRELKKILRLAENGSRGFCAVSGLRLKLIDPHFDAPSSDLNHDGRSEPWKVNRLLEAQIVDARGYRGIQDDRYYTVAMPDYLVRGGDDMSWAVSSIDENRINWEGGGLIRDAVANYLSRSRISEVSPRLRFERPAPGHRAKSRKKRHQA